jgi:hypothetical protein
MIHGQDSKMISIKFAKEQISRLEQLDFFPTDNKAAIKDLINAAMTAETETACAMAIDAIVSEARECPKPADIRHLIVSQAPARPNLSKGCPFCYGTGFKTVKRTVKTNRYSFAEPCSCRSKPVLVRREAS